MTQIHDYATPADRDAFAKGTPGIYVNVPFFVYLKHPAMSRSAVMTVLNETLAHFKHERDNPDHSFSEAFLWGSAVHCRLQEPDEFARRYRRAPENLKTGQQFGAASKAFAEALEEARADGCELYLDSWNLDAICDAIRTHPDTRRILEGRPLIEATVIWTDEESGLLCKARPDNLNIAAGIFCDVKTAESANPAKFMQSACEYGYFDQVAHYANGLKAVFGREFDGYLIPVEKKPYHAVGCYAVTMDEPRENEGDEPTLMVARERVAWALKQIAKAEKLNQWPGYREQVLSGTARYRNSLKWRKQREPGAGFDKVVEEPSFMGGPDDGTDFNF